ncbi:MAG: GH116 family glycosyl-hydrolase, partial [Candidatus Hydrogenedentes bacterium]|nr:GH116 family glycosyl-hydrolase [Candidatus Hydrogenedentota bacterium]
MAVPTILGVFGVAFPTAIFNADADAKQLQQFRVEGLSNEVYGTVYTGGALEDGGMPLGGVGTGYLCVDTDGRFGKASIFNRYPAPMVIGQPFLSVKIGEREYVVAMPKDGVGDAKAVHYFGHFPIADVRFEFDAPFSVELRAFSPFIPGASAESNTPAALFEVFLTNLSSEPLTAAVVFSTRGFPQGEAESFSSGDWAGVQVAHSPVEKLPDWVKHTYAVAAEKGQVEPSDQGARVSVSRGLAANERGAFQFVLGWHQPYLRDGSGRVEKHMYAERFDCARAVALHATAQRESWLKHVLAWQDALYGTDLPGWLKETLVNAPYALTKNSL